MKYRVDLFRGNVKIGNNTEIKHIHREYFDSFRSAISWGLENKGPNKPAWLLERNEKSKIYEPVINIARLPEESF